MGSAVNTWVLAKAKISKKTSIEELYNEPDLTSMH